MNIIFKISTFSILFLLLGQTAHSDCKLLRYLYDYVETYEGYSNESSNTKFWEYHERHGVYRHNDKIILGAESKKSALLLVAELEKYFGTKLNDVEKFQSDNKKGYFIDITSMVPNEFLTHIGQKSRSAANCFGFCTFGNLSSASFSFSSVDLNIILRPPLAKSVAKVSLLEPGDVVLLRNRDPDYGNYSITNLIHGFQ